MSRGDFDDVVASQTRHESPSPDADTQLGRLLQIPVPRPSPALLCFVPRPSSALLCGDKRWLRDHSSAGTVATARQRGSIFYIHMQTESTRRCVLQRATCATDQTAMGLSRGETKSHQTVQRRVIFSLPWPNLLGSETNRAAIQDRDHVGCHTFDADESNVVDWSDGW